MLYGEGGEKQVQCNYGRTHFSWLPVIENMLQISWRHGISNINNVSSDWATASLMCWEKVTHTLPVLQGIKRESEVGGDSGQNVIKERRAMWTQRSHELMWMRSESSMNGNEELLKCGLHWQRWWCKKEFYAKCQISNNQFPELLSNFRCKWARLGIYWNSLPYFFLLSLPVSVILAGLSSY